MVGGGQDLFVIEAVVRGEEKYCKGNGNYKKRYIEDPFYTRNPEPKAFCYLCNKELVYLKGHIRPEEATDAKGGDYIADYQHYPPKRNVFKGRGSYYEYKQIKDVTVDNRDCKCKKVFNAKSPYDNA